ncbi:RNA 2',3'-cyclic phosphodiesterase [Phytohabitans sp. ZYX-F-186]|uniref:RNA 2',3'-cyclic phosphodiesterase n=1 Tax=Phytohabitans maris TaxID=3071409 RepID=A0ABU0ZUW7_9ACTN|nr:RNA 2',3'-cyclic phosphodiesterase [Phytohabitans sp. ZYX-F-186]MDQ7910566.1 RNA 2',3'-cyclic phosphodiesterase [Phytohabitans sp. ZYX-F-186]
MRLFVAVYPPAYVADDFAACVERLRVTQALRDGVNTRVASRDNWHVTLAFLGDVPDDRGDATATAVERAAALATPFEVRLAGGGRFGRGRFTILWVGVGGDLPSLAGLSRGVRRELKRARLAYDPKPLRPHMTVARPGDRIDRVAVDADRAALDAYESPPWTVAEVVLMRSHQGPKPTYDRLGAWPL